MRAARKQVVGGQPATAITLGQSRTMSRSACIRSGIYKGLPRRPMARTARKHRATCGWRLWAPKPAPHSQDQRLSSLCRSCGTLRIAAARSLPVLRIASSTSRSLESDDRMAVRKCRSRAAVCESVGARRDVAGTVPARDAATRPVGARRGVVGTLPATGAAHGCSDGDAVLRNRSTVPLPSACCFRRERRSNNAHADSIREQTPRPRPA